MSQILRRIRAIEPADSTNEPTDLTIEPGDLTNEPKGPVSEIEQPGARRPEKEPENCVLPNDPRTGLHSGVM